MKRNKQIIVLLSIVLLTSLFIGNFALAKNDVRYNPYRYNPFSQLWQAIFGIQSNIEQLQTQTSDLQSQETQTQTTIENLQTQINELQTQINDLETSIGTTRIVYEGTFDVFTVGDFIVHRNSTSNPITALHYKEIIVPELTLNDMPLVKVYTKPYSVTGSVMIPSEEVEFLNNVWYEQDYGTSAVAERTNDVLYGEGAVYIFYRSEIQGTTAQIAINGDYKIVVTK